MVWASIWKITNISYLRPYIKIILRWMTEPQVKAKTINLPEENTGKCLHNEMVSKDFLEKIQRATTMKGKKVIN